MTEAVKLIKPKKHFYISHVFIYIVLIIWSLTTIYPFFWTLINSFKDPNLITIDSFSIPMGKTFTLINYERAWTMESYDTSILRTYWNSIFISGIVMVVVIVLGGMAAFALTRYKFHGNKFLVNLVISSLMFPAFCTIIPVYTLLLSIYPTASDSALSVIMIQIAGNLSFAMIVLIGYMRSVPIDLEESAFLEGCNAFQVFFKIILPVSKPAFATVAIFSFLWSYNDLFTQLFFLRSTKNWALNILLSKLSSKFGNEHGRMCATIILIIVPVLIVYVFLQKNIIKGLTTGAIKG